ncbi:T9SS type A sorting domain-containing protein [Hymenobacter metallicola]|uniref:T9SS type A sorting domain-containing protein n=1 Tax=Hymenobacter metallicola TaxID=2563114 RepID=A0A4Z0PW51_9BACT|nr:T9SS type A sorting domain-containing protein [Hymenobacter metallicola]TGE21093.1 T9SS type A sorting domain-containing protein [Hymenobacter metallicola]
MKKSLSIGVTLCLWLSQLPAFAHKEWVHQHMVKESYLFLEQQLGRIDVLRDAVGLSFHGPGNSAQPFNNICPIGVGAWREDLEDPVYGYTLSVNTSTPSITHFWDADNWDEDHESMNLNVNGSSLAPNAWEKARVYLFCQDRNGSHDLTIPFALYGGPTRKYVITYTSLPELYKGNYYLEAITDMNGGNRINFYHSPRFDKSFGQPVALQILGRVAHLLGDMSVPAHAHSHPHPCPLGKPDFYENNMGNVYWSNSGPGNCENDPGGDYRARQWNAGTALQQGGLLADMYCEPDARARMKFLFYTLNQLADFFPSGVNPWQRYDPSGPALNSQNREPGDANLGNGPNHAFLQARFAALGGSPSDIDHVAIANETFNYSIRAVATLFQWFAFEAGIIETLKNEKLASNGQLLCDNSSLTFSVTKSDIFSPVTWEIEPAFAATGTVLPTRFFSRRESYSVTPTAGYNGLITVKSTYNSVYGCTSSPVTLTRQVWVGGPYATFLRGPGEYYVQQGNGFEMAAGVMHPDLEGNVSYQWTLTGANGVLGNTSSIYVNAPLGYDVPFELSCTITNSCGLSSTIYRGYRTTPYTGGDGQSWRPSKLSAGADSLKTVSSGDALEVFPNPSNTGFDVLVAPAAVPRKAATKPTPPLSYTLLDNLGRTVARGTSPDTKVHIDTQALPAGVYSLSCSMNGQTYHKRVQVLH